MVQNGHLTTLLGSNNEEIRKSAMGFEGVSVKKSYMYRVFKQQPIDFTEPYLWTPWMKLLNFLCVLYDCKCVLDSEFNQF